MPPFAELKSPDLRALQLWMRWAITHPAGPRQALQNDSGGRSPEPSPRHLSAIAEGKPLRREQRLAVYADAYFLRLLDCLRSDFLTLSKILGENAFRNLAADYLLRFPSASTTVGDLGSAMPEFLATHPLSGQMPFLADVARLEWIVLQSLYTNRLPPLDPLSLTNVTEDAWARARIVLDPTVRFFSTEWTILPLWEHRYQWESVEGRTAHKTKQVRLLIWRNGEWVQVQALPETQQLALEQFQQGRTLEQVCETLAAISADLPVMEWFSQWIRDGIIKKVEFNSSTS